MDAENASIYRAIEKLKVKADWDLSALEAREIEAMPRKEKETALAAAGIDVDGLQQRISALLSASVSPDVDGADPQP